MTTPVSGGPRVKRPALGADVIIELRAWRGAAGS